MNVAVIGAGPLGTLLAAELSRGRANVTLVTRSAGPSCVTIRLVPELLGAPWHVELPCSTELPSEVEVVVVAVRAEQLNEELLNTLQRSRAKAVLVFSPLMGTALPTWRRALPQLAVGMPALAAEFAPSSRSELHYWQVPSTLIERGPAPEPIQAVVNALRKGGALVRWIADAEVRTLANTVALFPLHVAVFRNPNLRAWVLDAGLRRELGESLSLSLGLARRLGPVEPALMLLVWWLSSAPRIALGVRLMAAFAPRVCGFVERHFGAKLGRQHAVLAREVQRLADLHGVQRPLNDVWLAGLPEVQS